MAPPPQPPLTEQQFQERVIDAARMLGWLVVHIRAAVNSRGRWMVPYEGDAGLPDLILARNGTVLLVELKSDTGVVSAAQQRWLTHAGSHGRVWRPRDWPTALAELRSL